ncbi:MAG TPA: hypothetical protein VL547_23900 [Dinghuibacter sp.]|jgi:hypothetical protein|uniref:hypothetical protein n=1 Tax=Dinghuibacter sp. TaxID=2024697 RepID=UPI002CC93503|nr:hypothetical protein [Dinghuibacter sp.]HTJ15109.1 hypothetical protein [Dinghuibacter sp.]
MKKILVSLVLAGALAACNGKGKSIDSNKIDSSAPTEATDNTKMANDSAKRSSDSLVNTSPDTLKAK